MVEVLVTAHVKVAGAWRDIGSDGIWTNVAGTYRQVLEGHVKVSGAWNRFYARDTVAPTPPLSVQARFQPYGIEQLTWNNPSDSDFYSLEIRAFRSGALVAQTTTYGSPGQSMSWSAYIPGDGVATQWLLTPVDTTGNVGATTQVWSMEWTGAARGRVASPFTLRPYTSRTYVDATGSPYTSYPANSWYTTRVVQGYDLNQWRYGGGYFYGDDIWNAIRGATVTGASIQLRRVPSAGIPGGVAPDLWWSTLGSPSGAIPLFDEHDASYSFYAMARDGSRADYSTVSIINAWLPYISEPSSTRLRSIFLYSTDSVIVPGMNTTARTMEMYASSESPGTVTPGLLTVEHNG